MADPWESNNIDLNSYFNGGSGLTGMDAVQSGASSYGAGASWDWGKDLSYLLRAGVNTWAGVSMQQAANGNRYLEGQPITSQPQQVGFSISPALLLIMGAGALVLLAQD